MTRQRRESKCTSGSWVRNPSPLPLWHQPHGYCSLLKKLPSSMSSRLCPAKWLRRTAENFVFSPASFFFSGVFSVPAVCDLAFIFVFWINLAMEISEFIFCYIERMKGINTCLSCVELNDLIINAAFFFSTESLSESFHRRFDKADYVPSTASTKCPYCFLVERAQRTLVTVCLIGADSWGLFEISGAVMREFEIFSRGTLTRIF